MLVSPHHCKTVEARDDLSVVVCVSSSSSPQTRKIVGRVLMTSFYICACTLVYRGVLGKLRGTIPKMEQNTKRV